MKEHFIKIIKSSLAEDKAFCDITSDLTIKDEDEIEFNISARQNLILCGINSAKLCFEILKSDKKFSNSTIEITNHFKDGDKIQNNEIIISGIGSAKLIFAAERVILNILQHLSAISTLTRKHIEALNDNKISILDTRKTTMGLRHLEKYAVLSGGGKNHRTDLSDMILIKDNHIAASGGVLNALNNVKNNNSNLKIEIECDNLDQVQEVIRSKIDIIMLDNMTPELVRKAKNIIQDKAKIEVSGGINIKNIANYRNCGADYISVGALTHSAGSVDIGLDVI